MITSSLTRAELPGKKFNLHIREYLYVSLKTYRMIFHCRNKACKHVYAYDYRRVYYTYGCKEWNSYVGWRYEPALSDLYRVSDGEERSPDHRLCPRCGRLSEEIEVKGKQVTDHQCDDRCKSAKNGECECSCGGVNHGLYHVH